MKVLFLWFAISASGLSQFGPISLDQSNKHGVVEVVLVDSFGGAGYTTGDIQIRREGEPYSAARTISSRTALRYGVYVLNVSASPAYPFETRVVVNRDLQTVLVPLFVAPIEGPWEGNFVRGRVPASIVEKGCKWARVSSPLSENDNATTRISEAGVFMFENVRPGIYVLTLFGAAKLCRIENVTIKPSRVQELSLSKNVNR